MLLFMGASVLTYLGLVMEYPGLDESEGENGMMWQDYIRLVVSRSHNLFKTCVSASLGVVLQLLENT